MIKIAAKHVFCWNMFDVNNYFVFINYSTLVKEFYVSEINICKIQKMFLLHSKDDSTAVIEK
jgi:hypothetical protein